jgi:hypothetical protein
MKLIPNISVLHYTGDLITPFDNVVAHFRYYTEELKYILEQYQQAVTPVLGKVFDRFMEISPFVMGLSGESIVVKAIETGSQGYWWNIVTPHTIYSLLAELHRVLQEQSTLVRDTKTMIESLRNTGLDVKFTDLADTPDDYHYDYYLAVNAGEDALEEQAIIDGTKTFLALEDTPSSYIDASSHYVLGGGGTSVAFAHRTSFNDWREIYIRINFSTTLASDQMKRTVISLEIPDANEDVYLAPTQHGAECYLVMIDRPNPRAFTAFLIGTNCLVEQTSTSPLGLCTSVDNLHLVYDTAFGYRLLSAK